MQAGEGPSFFDVEGSACGSSAILASIPLGRVVARRLTSLKVGKARAIVVRYSELLKVVLELARKRRMQPKTAARLAETLLTSQSLHRPGPGSLPSA